MINIIIIRIIQIDTIPITDFILFIDTGHLVFFIVLLHRQSRVTRPYLFIYYTLIVYNESADNATSVLAETPVYNPADTPYS